MVRALDSISIGPGF